MSPGPIVTIADLRRGIDLLLDETERKFGSAVDLDADFYSCLDPRRRYDPPLETSDQLIGSLVDDVEELQGLPERPSDGGLSLWHDLEHVIGILGRLAALDLPPER